MLWSISFFSEHVWQVNVLNRGIGGTSLLCGGQKIPEPLVYRLCLTDKTLSLVPKEHEALHIELSLSNIRSCGSLRNYVFLEVSFHLYKIRVKVFVQPQRLKVQSAILLLLIPSSIASRSADPHPLALVNYGWTRTILIQPRTFTRPFSSEY